MKWLLLALLLVAAPLEAQGDPPPLIWTNGMPSVDVTLPPESEYGQPPIYDSWWKEIGACEHVIVPTELTRAVHFVQVNSPTMIVNFESGVYGYASAPTFTVFLVLPMVWNKSVVEHEMLHMLDYWNGIDEGKDYHPKERFEVCGLHQFYP